MLNESLQSLSRRGFLKGMGAAAAVAAAAPVLAASAGVRPRAASDKVVRMGVVGGNFGAAFEWHLDPNCKVTAYCDLREDRLDRLTKRYGPAARYKSFREFLKHPELDAVAVFTPAPLHVWMATEAMKAGKHVISAVPAGMSVEELELLLETVKKTGLKYMMAETSYYRYQVITCCEWARQGKFGTIFYTEAEYHHSIGPYPVDALGNPTWRYGFPPMHYPTHMTGIVIPITGERLVEVEAMGWGSDHEVCHTNQYKNPFLTTTGFFKTSGGHCSRLSMYGDGAVPRAERGSIYGSKMSYIMERQEGSPDTVLTMNRDGGVIDDNGRPEGELKSEVDKKTNHFELLPPSLRVASGHGGSHVFLTHEFISSIVEDRWPTVNVYEAIAFNMPGIIAHQSALRGGEPMKIKDYGKAPA